MYVCGLVGKVRSESMRRKKKMICTTRGKEINKEKGTLVRAQYVYTRKKHEFLNYDPDQTHKNT
jgi:hypothetical protein